MMTATLHFDASLSAMIRGTTSSNGPGGTGTTILIVRFGNSSPAANVLVMAARQTAVQSQVISDKPSRVVIRCLPPIGQEGLSQPIFVGDCAFRREPCHGANVPAGRRR